MATEVAAESCFARPAAVLAVLAAAVTEEAHHLQEPQGLAPPRNQQAAWGAKLLVEPGQLATVARVLLASGVASSRAWA